MHLRVLSRGYSPAGVESGSQKARPLTLAATRRVFLPVAAAVIPLCLPSRCLAFLPLLSSGSHARETRHRLVSVLAHVRRNHRGRVIFAVKCRRSLVASRYISISYPRAPPPPPTFPSGCRMASRASDRNSAVPANSSFMIPIRILMLFRDFNQRPNEVALFNHLNFRIKCPAVELSFDHLID